MKVYEIQHKLVLPKSHGRSVGLHVSEILRDLAFKGNVLDKKYQTEIAIELQDTNLMQCGLAWEDYMERSNQHPEIEYHPGELKVRTGICARCAEDDVDHAVGATDCNYVELVIYMSPDGFTWDADGAMVMFLNEIKFTKKSCRDFAQGLRMGAKKSLMYVWQILAYLRGLAEILGDMAPLAAKLHVLFSNGDYSYQDPKDNPNAGTPYRIFRLEVTKEEVDSNWRMVLNHAREMIRDGRWTYAE